MVYLRGLMGGGIGRWVWWRVEGCSAGTDVVYGEGRVDGGTVSCAALHFFQAMKSHASVRV